MSTNDYVKYITQTFVKHFDTPKSDRIQSRLERKKQKNPFLYRWFGVLPYSIIMLFKRK
ncbi:YqzE family protein [Heyndrickxia oleronia]|uniref:YqzE family protein n=1 Tax=Heyndrickxia oleronia TaxID=38875 RepID=UPI001B2D74AD|nr:YqzE family protein [Heyndrickxia oleronia]GIN38353.1 YqzE family protein [Heyndrickxia oleronia]